MKISGSQGSIIIDITSGTKEVIASKDAYLFIGLVAYSFSIATVKVDNITCAQLQNNNSLMICTSSVVFVRQGTVINANCQIGNNGGAAITVNMRYLA